MAAYNEVIRSRAHARGWTFVDPNTVYSAALARTDAQGRYPQIRKCQLLSSAATPAQFQAAVLNSCPVTGATAASSFFGAAVSLDGVHPSGSFHFQFAGAIVEAM